MIPFNAVCHCGFTLADHVAANQPEEACDDFTWDNGKVVDP